MIGTWTARYRTVSPKSTVGGQLRENKKREKKREKIPLVHCSSRFPRVVRRPRVIPCSRAIPSPRAGMSNETCLSCSDYSILTTLWLDISEIAGMLFLWHAKPTWVVHKLDVLVVKACMMFVRMIRVAHQRSRAP
ncbi:hypothetical protein GW17_00021281 [Ensete ventricosum]|nr:hypothetical protein GW17_00021281 [Ensete ventricosum]